MATELASAYISLSIETSRVPAQVRSMFSGVSRQADQAGRDAGNRFGSGMAGGLKTLAGVAGVTAGVAGLGAAFKSVVTTGMNFTSSMNTMKAVSSASAAEMQKVSATARQLANDTSLPATSATDAAAAMVELAKGGFSVDQSMQAARGTLQLAAAAQIDAASAATIQSQALQAFGQNASYAGTAADILANAANASSAEIVDVASALQQSGTVANQFGLSMQDTAAAIALMANAGIQGSDAGTLLKSALLALTDQSNPAQGAIEELGLSVYDANGQFKGMSNLFGELNKASKSMSAEQYQAATATLFGSDAMRLAGIAAQSGAEGYDAMVVAMGRQGSAAEVAAAKTEGLPGAWERFKNSIEDASLSMYDALQGPLTSGLGGLTKGVSSLVDAAQKAAPAVGGFMSRIGSGIRDAYQTLQDSGKLEEWGNRLKNIWSQLSEAAENVGPIILQFSQTAAKAAAAMGFAAWEGFLAVLESTSEILNVAVVPMLQLLADVMGQSETATVGLLAAFLLFKMVPAVMGSVRGALAPLAAQARTAATQVRGLATATAATVQTARAGTVVMGSFGSAVARLGQQAPVIARMQSSFVNAAVGADRFGRTAGTAAAAGTGLRAAGAGIAGVFGGPVGLGLTAAAIGGMAWMSSVQQQKAATEAYKSTLEDLAESQKEMSSLLLTTRGAATTDVYKGLTSQVETYRESVEQATKADAKWTDRAKSLTTDIFTGNFSLTGTSSDKLDEAANKAREAKKALDELGVTSTEVSNAIGGNAGQWETFKSQLEATGSGGKTAAADLQGLRDVYLDQQDVARRVAPGVTELGEAFRVMGDESSSASDKMNALKAAMDAMNPARGKTEAMAQYGDTIRKVAESTKVTLDASQGLGDALLNADGSLNSLTANGGELGRTLADVADKTGQIATATGTTSADLQAVAAENQKIFEGLAIQTGLSVEKIKELYADQGGSTIDLSIALNGSGQVVQDLGKIKAAFDAQPDGTKVVEIKTGEVTDASLEKIKQFGFDYEKMPDGKTVKIIANDTATPVLNAVMAQIIAVGGMEALPRLDLNTAQFALQDQQARDALAALNQAHPNPEAGLIIQKLIDGKNVSVSELQILDDTTADPQVKLEVAAILEKIKIVNAELDRAAIARSVQFNISTGSPNAYGGTGAARELRGTGGAANGGFRAYANGGIDNLPKSAMIQNPKANLVQWAEPETHGEAFIPLAPAKRKRSLEIWKKTGELLGAKFQTFANGGVRASDFDDLAKGGFGASQPLTGAPYDLGGVNWGDCSGTASAFANLAAGLPPFGSRFATMTQREELAKRGAVPGRGGPGDLRFAWYNGGPQGGHTTTTLPSGVNAEMGGGNGGGMYGGSAAGVDGGSWTDFAHFPASMFGPSWTDPGDDPGGFVTRPDGTKVPLTQSGDFGADGGSSDLSSSSSSSSGTKSNSLSGMLGDAASAFVGGQVSDLLGVFSIPDSPALLSAYNQYTTETENRKKQWDEAKKSRSELESQQNTELTQPATPPPANISPTNPTPAQVAQDAQVTYDPSKGGAQWRPYVDRVLSMLGLGNHLGNKVVEQIDIESGGDPNAVNQGYSAGGGHPSGLLQALPDTFNAFKSKDLADNILDPLANIFACSNYAQNDPKYAGRGIEAIWPTRAGYKNGGPVIGRGGPMSDSIDAALSNGEFVHTAKDYRRNKWAVNAIHQGATLEPAVGSSQPQVVYNIQAGNTERAFNEAQRLEKKRAAIGLGRF